MPFKYRLPLAFFFTFLFLVFSVDATHGLSSPHARRSFALRKKPYRQLSLPDIVGDLLDGGTTPTSGSSSAPTTTSDTTSPPTTNPSTLPTYTDPPSTSSPATTTPSSSDTPSTNPPPSTSSSPSSSWPSTTSPTPSTTDPGSSSPSSSPSSDTPTSTPSTTSPASSSPSPSSSSTPTCLLDVLGNCIALTPSSAVSSTSDAPVTTSTTPTPSSSSSPSSSPTDSPTSPPQQTTPTPSSPPASSSETPTQDCPLGVVVGGVCVLPSSPGTSTPPASSSNPPSTSEPPPLTSPPSTTPDLDQLSSSTSSTTPNPGSSPSPTPTPTSSSPVDPCGPVGILLGLCSSNLSPPASTPPLTSSPPTSISPNPSDSSSQSTPSLTSSPSQSVDPCGPVGIALGLCTPSVVPSSSTYALSPPQSTDPCGSLGIALGLCSSLSSPPDSLSSSPSLPASGTVPLSGTLSGTLSQPSSSSDQSSPSVPTGLSGSLSSSASGSGSSSIPVIAFPSGANDSFSSTPSLSLTPADGRPFPSFTPPPQTQLSYVTDTSLLLGSSLSSSLPGTLSDPDAPTLSLAAPSNSPSTTTPVVLPANLPSRIYPPTPVDPNSLSGYSLVSILFQETLSWSFVAQNTQSQGQIISWLPLLVENALGLTSDQVKPFALQVYVPEDYSGPADVDSLLTTFLMYIPSDQVDVLASQIKVASSAFYMGLPPPYMNLAAQVDRSFAVNSVQDPNVVPGTTSSLTSSGNKSRTDAIIGVASALGGLALVVLGVLIYRSVKRSRNLRHHRLADPNAQNDPYPDRTGRDFDQDSVGGQRRRSFYFAEDSLRGQQAVQLPVAQPQGQHVMQPVSQVEYSYRTSPDGVRERRAPVVTGAISAPILTQSSLNW